MSARWQNRKTQSLLPNRNTNLTITYGPKYLYESSKIWLGSCIPDEHKTKNSHFEMKNRNGFIYPKLVLSSSWHSSILRENVSLQLLQSGKRQNGTYLKHLSIYMHCWRSWFLSYLIHTATKTDIIQMTWGSLEKKEMGQTACCGCHCSAIKCRT